MGEEPVFRVLGPLEVTSAGRPVAVTAPRQRVLLALLLLSANRALPVGRLIEAVWGAEPPRTARSQVHILVSALRRGFVSAGMNQRIETTAHGYVLRLAPGEADVAVFEDLCCRAEALACEGDLRAAAAEYRRALAVWRGAPLPDVDSIVVQGALVRLRERRLTAVEECVDAELRLGRHHELVGELKEFVAQHPLRERLRAQLMTALHRAGRQAEALEEYRSARRTMVEELGLEPSATLRGLEQSILSESVVPPAVGARSPEAAVVPLGVLPASSSVFTGRVRLVPALRDALGAAAAAPGTVDRGPAVTLSGMAGSGKSALALHMAHQVADAYPGGQLYADFGGSTAQPVTETEVLGQFLQALGVPASRIPDGAKSRALLYRGAVAGHRLLVVLDDVADESHVLSFLPPPPGCGVVITSRARLTALTDARHFELEPLEMPEAVELVETLLGPERTARESDALCSLVALCEGSPLALRIAASRLAARSHWTVTQLVDALGDPDRRLDVLTHGGLSVRSAIESVYRHLPAQARRLFRRLGRMEAAEFSAAAAERLLGVAGPSALEPLEALVDSRLVRVAQRWDGQVRYQLGGLVGAYAREQGAAAGQAR